MEYWGVVLMTITFANGGVANYGDVERDTYSGWYTSAEVCAESAGERNDRQHKYLICRGDSCLVPYARTYPYYHFECKQRKAS